MLRLTYIARSGQEIPLASESDCAAAIRSGDLHRESLVMDGSTGRWMKAAQHGELEGLLARIRVTGPTRAASRLLRVATVAIWLAALIVPPAIAWAIGAEAMRVAPQSLTCAVVLAIVSFLAGFLIKSPLARWRLGLLLAILAFAAGLEALAESTGALGAGLMPAVTRLFAPGAK